MLERIFAAALIATMTISAANAACPPPRGGEGKYSDDDTRRALCQQEELGKKTNEFGLDHQTDADRRAIDRLNRQMDRFNANMQRQMDRLNDNARRKAWEL